MTSCRRIAILAALIVLTASRTSWAGELGGSVNLRDGIIYVEVDDDGKPAVGVPVRLQEARKKEIVAQGRINAEGKWSWPLLKAGSYEVVIGSGQAGQTPLVLPVDQRESVEPAAESDAKKCAHCPPPSSEEARFPWLPFGLGLGFLGSCGLVVWFGKFRGRSVDSAANV